MASVALSVLCASENNDKQSKLGFDWLKIGNYADMIDCVCSLTEPQDWSHRERRKGSGLKHVFQPQQGDGFVAELMIDWH